VIKNILRALREKKKKYKNFIILSAFPRGKIEELCE